MNRRAWSLALILLSLTACGAGDSGLAHDSPNEDALQAAESAQAWLASDLDSAVLLRWTADDDQQVSGVLQAAQLDGYEVTGESWPIEGLLGGQDLTLTVDGLFGGVTRLTGDYEADRLTLYWPSDSGALEPILLHKSTVAEYNTVVADLRTSGSEQQAWAEQAEAENRALADADQGLASAKGRLELAIQGFGDSVDFAESSTGYVATALEDLHAAVSDLEDAVVNDPDYVPTELAWVESEFQYLESEVEYARGENGVDGISLAMSGLRVAIDDVETALGVVRQVEDLYLSSEFAPHDATPEKALVSEAQGILDVDGPGWIEECRLQVEDMVSEAEGLVEYARSLDS